jgi:hypothetical protein
VLKLVAIDDKMKKGFSPKTVIGKTIHLWKARIEFPEIKYLWSKSKPLY